MVAPGEDRSQHDFWVYILLSLEKNEVRGWEKISLSKSSPLLHLAVDNSNAAKLWHFLEPPELTLLRFFFTIMSLDRNLRLSLRPDLNAFKYRSRELKSDISWSYSLSPGDIPLVLRGECSRVRE